MYTHLLPKREVGVHVYVIIYFKIYIIITHPPPTKVVVGVYNIICICPHPLKEKETKKKKVEVGWFISIYRGVALCRSTICGWSSPPTKVNNNERAFLKALGMCGNHILHIPNALIGSK